MTVRVRHGQRPSRSDQDRPILPTELANSLGDTMRRVTGVAVLIIVAVLWACLLSWSINDPGLSRVTSTPPRNLLGVPGAFAADLGVQLLGFAVFAVLLAPMFWAVALIRGDRLPPLWRLMILHVISIAALAGTVSVVASVPGWPLPYGLGGAAGDGLLKLTAAPLATLVPATDVARPVAALLLALLALPSMLSACGVTLWRTRHSGRNWATPIHTSGTRARGQTREPELYRDSALAREREPTREPELGWPAQATSRSAREGRAWGAISSWDAHDPIAPQHPTYSEPEWEPAGPSISTAQAQRQYGPYASGALDHGLDSGIDHGTDDAFDGWTEASSSGMAARFVPSENTPHALQDAVAGAFGLGSAMTRRDLSRQAVDTYRRPSLNLLARPVTARAATAYTQSLVRGNARLLADALSEFGIDGTITGFDTGPVLTVYYFAPAPGTKLSRIIALADDIARHLGVVALRICESGGRGLIAVEMPNADRQPIMLRDCLDSDAYRASMDPLPIALGRSVTGAPVIASLAQMPHLLVSGSAGTTSKATGLNAMILSLIYRHGPEDCRFLMIDPRMVDLSVYDGIPHLITPVVADPHKAITALQWCVREMDERIKRMATLGVRNIELFNNRVRNAKKRGERLQRTVQTGFDERTGAARFEKEDMNLEPMPYIVIVVEEIADLMAVAGKDIEAAVGRLAKAARGVGIHLIVATERPTADIVTAAIRASIPGRLAFKAANRAESRTVVGDEGAEHLLGGGDSLYASGTGLPVRVHGPSVSAEEVESVAMSLKERGETRYIEAVLSGPPGVSGYAQTTVTAGVTAQGSYATQPHAQPAPPTPADDLYDRAVAVAVRDRGASIGHLQGTLKVSAGWAASLLARLEADGVIGPADARGIHYLRASDGRSVA